MMQRSKNTTNLHKTPASTSRPSLLQQNQVDDLNRQALLYGHSLPFTRWHCQGFHSVDPVGHTKQNHWYANSNPTLLQVRTARRKRLSKAHSEFLKTYTMAQSDADFRKSRSSGYKTLMSESAMSKKLNMQASGSLLKKNASSN